MTCDYLILTASNEHQANVYRRQLQIRRQLGFLTGVDKTLVIPDIGGKRIGSGGSTLCCLLAVLKEEINDPDMLNSVDAWAKALSNKRVLIMHAGGDSKRLPAYGPCGKLFVPVPGQSDSPVPLTLFDKQLPRYLSLFDKDDHSGQFIITSGDVLLRFETDPLVCKEGVLIGYCCPADTEQASRHGVFCLGPQQSVRLYLQKPSPLQQQKYNALNTYNQAMLDIGIMAFDGQAAIRMLKLFDLGFDHNGQIRFESDLAKALIENGFDFYRELCCVFGSEATEKLHRQSAWDSGSTWSQDLLSDLFDRARAIDFQAKVLSRCDFLDFGSVRQIINSGYRLVHEHTGNVKLSDSLTMNTSVSPKGTIAGSPVWVEGCSINAALDLEGNNIVTGIDLEDDLSLTLGQCLDMTPGRNHEANAGWFVRCYGFEDDFKLNVSASPQYCNIPIHDWMRSLEIDESDIWDGDSDDSNSLFNARLFPFVTAHQHFRDYLWMFTPIKASKNQIDQWRSAPRFSHADIAQLTDDKSFLSKRQSNRLNELTDRVPYLFRRESSLSASDLSYILNESSKGLGFFQNAICTAYACSKSDSMHPKDVFISSRILHSLATALEQTGGASKKVWQIQSDLKTPLSAECTDWLDSIGVSLSEDVSFEELVALFKSAAFKLHSRAILQVRDSCKAHPRSCLRTDEIVWARAPARLDIAGGWTDTPPYALEWGGTVLNAAVNLNGQPPIQAYLRVIDEPVIKIGSIDLGLQVVIKTLDELTNYADVTSGFSLVKVALLQELFSVDGSNASYGQSLEQLLTQFGGGIELTTLAAIPKGSGLGTSSIMGAVIVAAINRAIGKELSDKELFNAVLKLEQALTTGGGWQDQIGGVLEGVKLILTDPGLVPDPSMQYLRRDVIDPALNDGRTLLYYTGITRLAKNILKEVVGKYLNRDRHVMRVLGQIRQAASDGAEAFLKMDYPRFGSILDRSWQLNKALDPNSSNQKVESLFERISSHVYGAKLLGAGGGGFVLMACKSNEDTMFLREDLTSNPSEPNARFFDYDVSSDGLVVTVC
ncbi:MAG: fucose pyrophosphorylase domain-containing protein [Planctomycetota bacterium]